MGIGKLSFLVSLFCLHVQFIVFVCCLGFMLVAIIECQGNQLNTRKCQADKSVNGHKVTKQDLHRFFNSNTATFPCTRNVEMRKPLVFDSEAHAQIGNWQNIQTPPSGLACLCGVQHIRICERECTFLEPYKGLTIRIYMGFPCNCIETCYTSHMICACHPGMKCSQK